MTFEAEALNASVNYGSASFVWMIDLNAPPDKVITHHTMNYEFGIWVGHAMNYDIDNGFGPTISVGLTRACERMLQEEVGPALKLLLPRAEHDAWAPHVVEEFESLCQRVDDALLMSTCAHLMASLRRPSREGGNSFLRGQDPVSYTHLTLPTILRV